MTRPVTPQADAAPADGPPAGESPADRLRCLWDQGQRPDVQSFVATAGPLTADELATLLRVDQRGRWTTGERIVAESYLDRFPAIRSTPEAVIDLVFNEFLLREKLGERPDAEDYGRRFPDLAPILRQQFALHAAMMGDTSLPDDAVAVAPEPAIERTFPQAAAPSSPSLPEVFGRYRILRRLGEGGMAAVYLAHDAQLDRSVALKVPHFDELANPGFLERFAREARIAAGFHHPHLCPVYDVGQVDGIHYLTMPFLSGEPLSQRLARAGRLAPATAARFAAQVARAMHVAHQAGVIHRDLKPSNIMVNEAGEPVVMDFGLARRGTMRDVRLTGSGTVLGTAAYMAPEQIGGDAAQLGPACDIYSLGVILYETLTGRLPFRGAAHELLTQTLTRAPEPPSQHCPEVAPHLDAACLRALAKDPHARFASMEEFAIALENAGAPAARAKGEPPARPGSTLARAAGSWWTAGAALALVVLLVLVLLMRPMWSGPVDALQPGSTWSGQYRFADGGEGEVALRITERHGEQFRGRYSTMQGAYEWLVAGTVRGPDVQWQFVEVVREQEPQGIVGVARVSGTWAEETIHATYVDHNSRAVLTLRLQK